MWADVGLHFVMFVASITSYFPPFRGKSVHQKANI